MTVAAGIGDRSIERLILEDPQAVYQAPQHLDAHRHQLHRIPLAGEKISLDSVPARGIGAPSSEVHRFITPTLSRSFDRIGAHIKGFYFGRFKVGVSDKKAFAKGRGFKILDFNGVTPEATHLHGLSGTLRSAWGMLMQHWKIAFEIGKINRKKGAPTLTVVQFLKLFFLRRRVDDHPYSR